MAAPGGVQIQNKIVLYFFYFFTTIDRTTNGSMQMIMICTFSAFSGKPESLPWFSLEVMNGKYALIHMLHFHFIVTLTEALSCWHTNLFIFINAHPSEAAAFSMMVLNYAF